MPVVHSVVSEANTHIHLPMITQVAHHLVNSLNLPQYIKEPYRRFVERKLRENFDLRGCQVQLFFREK